MKFNTAVASMMEFVNEVQSPRSKVQSQRLEDFLKILAPFAPHISEEMWSMLGHKESIFKEKWPKYDPKIIIENEVNLVIQINGKVRGTIIVPTGLSEKEAVNLALKSEKIQKWFTPLDSKHLTGREDKKIQKTIFVKNKLINFVVE